MIDGLWVVKMSGLCVMIPLELLLRGMNNMLRSRWGKYGFHRRYDGLRGTMVLM